MSEQKHTPLPWIYSDDGLNDVILVGVKDRDGDWIANIGHIMEPVCDTDKVSIANAKFIVKACNSYDKLRKVNTQLAEALEEIVQMERLPIVTSRYSHKLRYDKMSSIAQAALAAAKEVEGEN